jgi:hypothetical protein
MSVQADGKPDVLGHFESTKLPFLDICTFIAFLLGGLRYHTKQEDLASAVIFVYQLGRQEGLVRH